MVQNYQAMQLIDQNESYINERASAIENINKTLAELGGIFSQLATTIHAQGQLADRIDLNILDAESNVQAGHELLLLLFQSVSSNRGLMLRIFGVLIVFFLLFVLFLA